MTEFIYKLFKYRYTYYVQGSEEQDTEYALLYVPKDATLNNNKSVLFKERNRKYFHEIDYDSIENLTIIF